MFSLRYLFKKDQYEIKSVPSCPESFSLQKEGTKVFHDSIYS